jgi:UDP-N-acetylmuramyl pentapeptide phosphotransferase/UDP-N-acetylglucosamine-1-phosphate transferase
MKSDSSEKGQRLQPVINWLLVFAGIAVTATFIGVPLREMDRTAVLVFLWSGGPYLLLGLGCHLFSASRKGRRLGLALSAVHFVVYAALQTYYLNIAPGARGEFVFLLLPAFFWLYALVAFFILLITRLAESRRKREAGRVVL